MLRAQYGFGDLVQLDRLDSILKGNTQMRFGDITDAQSQAAEGNGKRIVHMKMDWNGDWKLGVVMLDHEAHRDGIIRDEQAQKEETRETVKGHTDMMSRMLGDNLYARDMSQMIAGNQNLQMDLLARSLGDDIFNAYVEGCYDSSADYWRMMSDGTLVQDTDGFLKDENGNFIRDKDGNKIGAAGQETGLLNILFAKQEDGSYKNPGKNYDDFSTLEKIISNHIMSESEISYYYKDPNKMGIQNTCWNLDGKALDMNLVMDYAGDSIATAVFMNYYDNTTNSIVDGKTSISSVIAEYKDSGYLNRLLGYYNVKNNFYNGNRKLFDTSSQKEWTQDFGSSSVKDNNNAQIYADNMHKGIDIWAAQGTSVYAFYSGKVVGERLNISSSGYSTIIEYGFNFEGSFYDTGISAQFMHFNEDPSVSVGEYLSATTKVGNVGHTGTVSGTPGNHLHYQLMGNLQGEESDSYKWNMLQNRRNYFLQKFDATDYYYVGRDYKNYYYNINNLKGRLGL